MKFSFRQIVVIVTGLGLFVLAAWGIYSFVSKSDDKPRKAPKISLIPQTPPPPPPPPKEEKKPDPPKQDDNRPPPPTAQPKEAPPAPSQELKMEGPAGDGPSAFSAGKISNEDLANFGKAPVAAASGLFNPFSNYATQIKGELQRQLARNKVLREAAYKVEVHVWVGRDGSITRFELSGGSGDAEVDDQIKKAIGAALPFTSGPPDKMPQPIRLRIVTGR